MDLESGRAAVSEGPPGGQGTTTVTGLLGQACARQAALMPAPMTNAASLRTGIFFCMLCLLLCEMKTARMLIRRGMRAVRVMQLSSDLVLADDFLHAVASCVELFCRGGSVFRSCMVFFRHLRDLFDLLGDAGAGDALFADGVADLADAINGAAGAGADLRDGRVGCIGALHADAHAFVDGLHALDGVLRIDLHGGDGFGNDLGRLRGAFGQLAHFVGDDGKTAALFAGAGCFDGGVQREQIGLVGDFLDDADDFIDALAVAIKIGDIAGSRARTVLAIRLMSSTVSTMVFSPSTPACRTRPRDDWLRRPGRRRD